ncbi:hypothetical protein DIPPA_02540 [Diplonema papillatum]|nr:hypothetical protein DIPPA_02540 [Diplonema papillatum]
MMYAQCTKHNQRRAARPVDLRDRSAENPKITKRTDVERGTEGKVFWGDMRPEEGKQTHPKVWVTSHHVDYPQRQLEARDTNVIKSRSDFMRSESIKLGGEKTPMERSSMQKLDRAHYVGGIRHLRGGDSTKTRSELYVCPAEIEEWKKKHLKAMSHRQFGPVVPSAPQGPADEAGTCRAIRKDMLRSHFQVGSVDEADARPAAWVTSKQVDYPKQTQAQFAANILHSRVDLDGQIKASSSSLALNNPNWSEKPVTTSASDYPNRLKQQIHMLRAASAPTSRPPPIGGSPGHRIRIPPVETAASVHESTLSSDKTRSLQHTRHSWKLGYEDRDHNMYTTQNQVAFTNVVFTPKNGKSCSLSASMASNTADRRNSIRRMLHKSSVPI